MLCLYRSHHLLVLPEPDGGGDHPHHHAARGDPAAAPRPPAQAVPLAAPQTPLLLQLPRLGHRLHPALLLLHAAVSELLQVARGKGIS